MMHIVILRRSKVSASWRCRSIDDGKGAYRVPRDSDSVMHLSFALGKAYDDLGIGTSLSSFIEGNNWSDRHFRFPCRQRMKNDALISILIHRYPLRDTRPINPSLFWECLDGNCSVSKSLQATHRSWGRRAQCDVCGTATSQRSTRKDSPLVWASFTKMNLLRLESSTYKQMLWVKGDTSPTSCPIAWWLGSSKRYCPTPRSSIVAEIHAIMVCLSSCDILWVFKGSPTPLKR